MSYSTYTSIMVILPLLPNTTSEAGWSDTVSVVSKHIERADGIIDGYCARRYSLPFASSAVPVIIRTISQDLAAYYTYRSFYTQDNHNKNEYLEELYAQAREDLEKIRDGDLDLVNTGGSDAPVKTSETQSMLDSTTKDYHSFFDIDDPLDWKFDSDLEDDVNDAR